MRTPQLFFEQIYLREKTKDCFSKARKAELTDDAIAGEMAAIERSNAEILSAYGADAMRDAVMKKLAARAAAAGQGSGSPALAGGSAGGRGSGGTRPPLRFRTFAAVSAAAACLAFALFVALPRSGGAAGDLAGGGTGPDGLLLSAERAKGDGPKLFIYLKDGNTAVLLEDNSLVRENDVLQMSYVAAGQTYGVILSVDGGGTVTAHYPEKGASAAKLDGSGEIRLDFAYQLDAAPDFERFFFITGTKPFTVAGFMENIRIRARIGDLQTADLSMIVPPGTRLTDITLLK